MGIGPFLLSRSYLIQLILEPGTARTLRSISRSMGGWNSLSSHNRNETLITVKNCSCKIPILKPYAKRFSLSFHDMSVFLFLVQYKNVINFSKRRQQFNIVQNMRRFRNEVHNFPRHDRIIEFFSNFDDFLSEEAMWQMSETIKPRGKPKHWPGVLVCCESRDEWPLWNAGPIQSNRSLFVTQNLKNIHPIRTDLTTVYSYY